MGKVLGWVGVLVVVGVIANACDGGSASSGSSDSNSYGAESVCEKSVENQLKAPTTASFSGEDASGSSGSYTVSGNVDSENSFGAKLRASWSCTATLSGDTWTGYATVND